MQRDTGTEAAEQRIEGLRKIVQLPRPALLNQATTRSSSSAPVCVIRASGQGRSSTQRSRGRPAGIKP